MQLPTIIRQLSAQYLREGMASSYEDINKGLCESFASDIQDLVPDVSILAVEELMKGKDGDPSGSEIFDWALLDRHWGVSPPQGLTREDVNGMVLGGHFWMVYEGRHYDAECPDGVNSFFELPYFHRQIESQLSMATSQRDIEEPPWESPAP